MRTTRSIAHSRFWILAALGIGSSYSCSSESSSDINPDARCANPGETQGCYCINGGMGTATCLPDGTLSHCVCDPVAAGTGGVSGAGASGAQPGGFGGGAAGVGGEVVGSGGEAQGGTGGSGEGASDGGAGVTGGTGGTAATGGTGGTAATGGTTGPITVQPSVDCNNLPPLPIADFKKLDHVPGAEDFTFDDQGYLVAVGTSNNALFRCPYQGASEVLSPNAGTPSRGGDMTVRGIRFLPDGDIVFADRVIGALVRMNTTDYSKKTVFSGVNEPNGVAVGMDGMVYLTEAGGGLHRIDPDTGASTQIFNERISLDGVAFNADYSRIYFNSEAGYVSYIPFNADGTTGQWELAAEIPPNFLNPSGGLPALDGMAADECGNIYCVEMSGIIWRISPDGAREEAVNVSGSSGFPFGFSLFNAANFGTGIGGWRKDAIYVISMDGGAYEVVLGVSGAPQPHLH